MEWHLSLDDDFGLSIGCPLFCLCAPTLWVYLPWVWVEIDIRQDGGFWIVLTDPKRIGGYGPRLIAQGGAVGRFKATWQDER